MANLVQCPSCQSRLSLGNDFRGQRVRCPRCQQVVEVGSGGGPSASPVAAATPPPTRRAPLPPPREVEPPVAAAPLEDDYGDPERTRRRKKRRRRKHRERGSRGKPAWIWLVFGAGAFMVILTFIGSIFLATKLDITVDLVAIAIGLAIMMPISAVVAFLSMWISSAILGGIDFGPIPLVILKGAAMLFFVNLCYMMPLPMYFGVIFALAVWTCGWMFFFGLEFLEARVLAIISWGLMTIVRLFLLAVLVSLVQHGKLDPAHLDPNIAKEREAEAQLEAELLEELDAVAHFAKLGATILRYDEGDPNEGKVRGLLCSNSQVQDADLAELKKLRKINTIALAGRPITDKGLKHLAEVKTLVIIGLENTKVTDAGIKALRKALPNAWINGSVGGAGSAPGPINPP